MYPRRPLSQVALYRLTATESQVLDTIVNGSGQGMRECCRQRLKAMRADLGHAEASQLERLIIQQVTLCWLNLNLTEYRHTNVMKQSISLACGIYWEKRLTAAQRRFSRSCETLAREYASCLALLQRCSSILQLIEGSK